MRTWYLVRHGETEWNAARRMQGQLDAKLTPEGRVHAKSSGGLLAKSGIDALYASPLGRVRETLAIIADDLHMEPVFDDRLMEWSGGVWDGEFYKDIAVKWPTEFNAWEADRHSYRPPKGENFYDLADRGGAVLNEIAAKGHQRIAIVAHGFINRAMAGVLLGLDPGQVQQIKQANSTVIRVTEAQGGATVDHFRDGEGPFVGLPTGEHKVA